MVDILQNYMQDAISLVRAHRPDNGHDDHGTTNFGTQRRATEFSRRKIQTKKDEEKAISQSLFQIKESTLQTVQIPVKPLNGLTCKTCISSTTNNVSDKFYRPYLLKPIFIIVNI